MITVNPPVTVGSAQIADGSIVDADISASAAISASKLNLDTDGTLAANSDTGVASQKATKSYVDAVAQGLSPKPSVRLATAAALAANTYSNGVLTGSATGVLTVDGATVALNDRVLVKNEAAQANNGIYKCTTAGVGGGTPAAYVLTRATDMDAASEIPGAYAFVEAGSTNVGRGYVVASIGPFTLGSTSIVWTQFSGAGEITAGTGLTKSGDTMSVDTTTTPQKSDNLSVFAATTSAQLAGVISNETGTGALVFANSPALVTPTGIVKGDVGLGNVDNTSNATERAATATLTNKTLTSPVINTPTGIVKGDVGLGNVANAAQAQLATLTAKGDLYVATGNAAVTNLAASGTNGQTLVSDSNAASGLKYVANAGITSYGPLDFGFLGGNGDPAFCPGGTLLSTPAVAGTLVLVRIRVPIACTITNLLVYLTASGNTLTANQCLGALYNSSGTWLKTTTNQATNWAGTAGLQTMALTSTYAAAAGDYYIGLFYNGTTAPTFARYSVTAAGLCNAGLAAPNLRFCTTNDTSLTTAPPTTSFGTQTASSAAFFAAVS